MSLHHKNGETTVRLGIIGLGGATRQIMPSFASHPEVAIAAATDLRAEARERFAVEYGATAHATAEDLCRDASVNTVYIATPHQYHKEHVLLAAAHGKHVIVEKPMALTVRDCQEMAEAAERHGVHLIVGHTHSFDRPVLKMREIIHSGALGELAMVNTWSYSNFLMRPRRPEELDTRQGGGIIYNQLPHQVDMVRLLGGGLVHSVRSMVWSLDPSRPTEGSHATFLQFESGAAATLVFSGYDYFDSDEFHFWVGESGERKRADGHGRARASLSRFADGNEEGRFKSAGAYGHAAPTTSTTGGASEPWHQPHCGVIIVSCTLGDMRPSADGVLVYGRDGRREVAVSRGPVFPDKSPVADAMVQAIVTGEGPIQNGGWGAATMEVCEAVLESARTRREVFLEHQVSS